MRQQVPPPVPPTSRSPYLSPHPLPPPKPAPFICSNSYQGQQCSGGSRVLRLSANGTGPSTSGTALSIPQTCFITFVILLAGDMKVSTIVIGSGPLILWTQKLRSLRWSHRNPTPCVLAFLTSRLPLKYCLCVWRGSFYQITVTYGSKTDNYYIAHAVFKFQLHSSCFLHELTFHLFFLLWSK